MNDLQAFSESVRIPFLVHFTPIENLSSILQHGIYPRSRFNELPTQPTINDTLRLDEHLDGTSLSIAFPNSRMFFRLRQDSPERHWAVLLLSPSILWTKRCAFCMHNAADARIRCMNLDALCAVQSFRGMFEGENRETYLQPFDPTDEQAEVLVFDLIEPGLIGSPVLFSSPGARSASEHALFGRSSKSYPNNKGFFASRSYFRRWP